MVEGQAGDASRRDWSAQRLAVLGTGCVPDLDHAVVSAGGQLCPSGWNARPKIPPRWPVSANKCLPAAASQNMTVLSSLVDARRLPSALNAS